MENNSIIHYEKRNKKINCLTAIQVIYFLPFLDCMGKGGARGGEGQRGLPLPVGEP